FSLGYCWPFQASQSQVDIQLLAQVQPTAITVQHPLKKSSGLRDIKQCPRDFTISVSFCKALGAGTWCWGKAGVDEEGGEETLLGTFSFNIGKKPTQTFPLQVREAFQYIRLLALSNWGQSGYACVYREQAIGK
ncbi:SUN2 protein, partial [Dromas ardeola]|nr:SUN2 protein [Dromas ardeola]